MPVRDTVELLRDLDPVGARPVGEAGRHRRRRGRALGVLATAAVASAGALVLTVDRHRGPGFAELAYAALADGDRIVHLRLRSTFLSPADEPARAELWSRGAGRQLRVIYDGGDHEFVRDTDARHAASYVRGDNTLTVFTEPEMWQVAPAADLDFAGPEGARRIAEDLSALLRRARDGDPAVRRLPDAALEGRAAARLETTGTVRASPDPAIAALEPVAIRTVVWFDLDTHLPRRIERFRGDRVEAITEVVLAERLSLDENTRRLLEMPRHPGARRTVGRG